MHPYNNEFLRLMKKAGWNKAETARQLEITPAVITRYSYGETRPSLMMLKLFKMLIGDKSPLPEDDRDQIVADLQRGKLLDFEYELIEQLRTVPMKKAADLAWELTAIAEIGTHKGE